MNLHHTPRAILLFSVWLLVLIPLSGLHAQADDLDSAADAALWRLLAEQSHIAVMRHALAPGIGDPEEFDVADCDTQRNLSPEGRAQANKIGDRFRANGIASAAVFTSQWCRCRDTATELDLGPVTGLTMLNSFFRNIELREGRTEELRSWLLNSRHEQPVVLVTHQVNISALTGSGAASGDIVVFRMGDDGAVLPVGVISTAPTG